MKLGFLLRVEPYSHQGMDTALHLIRAALARQNEVELFLYESAVGAANTRVKSGGERSIVAMIAEVAALGVPVNACSACCRFRGIGKSDLAPGVAIAGLTTLARMVEDCDRIVTLGL